MKIKQLLPLAALASYLFIAGCDDQLSNVVDQEPIKDISGIWSVVQLTRNGEDLTSRLDLKDFSINFKEDGTFAVQDALPFVLQGSGTYKLSDPQYPFSLLMDAGNGGEVAVQFQFPVVEGRRQLSLSFSLGCSGNTYQYNFERQN
ncbi:DUF5004 domain-containing protein [Sphingobacterium suaedae]|uniref:DUF5004 domain-containing protein n=1 Tax=Sphingobacterium suaedae TaxID=1686402 RepID=A0ABW5KK06_9SPHI